MRKFRKKRVRRYFFLGVREAKKKVTDGTIRGVGRVVNACQLGKELRRFEALTRNG